MDLDSINAELPLQFRLGRRLVIAKKAEVVNVIWPKVCRLELTQPLLVTLIQPIGVLCPWIKTRWPEWFLPPTVIFKRPKPDWEEEYATEKQAYNLLKPLQGTVIPYFYGEAIYGESPALVFSAIAGITLLDLACNEFPVIKEEVMEKAVDDAFKALTSYGVEHWDQKLDNFIWADERVIVIDLEDVKFGTTQVWEESLNSSTANSLLRDFMRTQSGAERDRLQAEQDQLIFRDPVDYDSIMKLWGCPPGTPWWKIKPS